MVEAVLQALAPLAIEFAASVIGFVLLGGLITGLVSLVQRRRVSELGTLLKIALVLSVVTTVPRIPETFRDVRMAFQAREIQEINTLFRELNNGSIATSELHARIADLPAASWPTELIDTALAALELKVTRYGDVHQSLAHGLVIRSELPSSTGSAMMTEIRSRDESTWVPILESAASGGPVQVADFSLTRLEESFALALASQRSYVAIADAFQAQHSVSAPRSSPQREIPEAVSWIGTVLESDAAAQSLEDVLTLSDMAWATISGEVDTRDFNVAFRRTPVVASSVLTYTWATATVDLLTEVALARTVIDGGTSEIDSLNRYRHFLAMPIVTDQDIDAVTTSGQMPLWSAYPEQAISRKLLETLEADASHLEERFRVFAPAWEPPTVRWQP